jgi:hypothetical protein
VFDLILDQIICNLFQNYVFVYIFSFIFLLISADLDGFDCAGFSSCHFNLNWLDAYILFV